MASASAGPYKIIVYSIHTVSISHCVSSFANIALLGFAQDVLAYVVRTVAVRDLVQQKNAEIPVVELDV